MSLALPQKHDLDGRSAKAVNRGLAPPREQVVDLLRPTGALSKVLIRNPVELLIAQQAGTITLQAQGPAEPGKLQQWLKQHIAAVRQHLQQQRQHHIESQKAALTASLEYVKKRRQTVLQQMQEHRSGLLETIRPSLDAIDARLQKVQAALVAQPAARTQPARSTVLAQAQSIQRMLTGLRLTWQQQIPSEAHAYQNRLVHLDSRLDETRLKRRQYKRAVAELEPTLRVVQPSEIQEQAVGPRRWIYVVGGVGGGLILGVGLAVVAELVAPLGSARSHKRDG
jgi:hypothetical protein